MAALPILSAAEVDESIRSGVDAQVARVWSELKLEQHYANLEQAKLYKAKEDAVHKELENTWNQLEF